jgi:hypothetical protein
MLCVPQDVVRKTFHTFRDCGRGECECGVFWTGPAGDKLVDGLEHPIHQRSPFGYEVDDAWLTEFWKHLAASRRSVKAQVHTHPGRAFHSKTDNDWPIVSQPGFISIVIPDFGMGEPSFEKGWVGHLGADGKWMRLRSASEVIVIT